MTPPQALYIGLMSGTSADNIDGVLVDLSQPKHLTTLATHNTPISQKIRDTVFALAISSADEIATLQYLDFEYAQLLSQTVVALCEQAHVSPQHIAAIGSHGQTVRHYPPNGENPGYSLQVGDPNRIAQQTGMTTVADFRRRDIAAGGHGAPLAPGFHRAYFQSDETSRFIVNTGGIANITYLPVDGDIIGFDTGPANGLMDSWCSTHQHLAYDEGGQWAATGRCLDGLLEKLLQHNHFTLAPPKSTGREDFNLPWLQQQLLEYGTASAEDVQATLMELTVTSIAQAIDELDARKTAEVYICGGGSFNQHLCDQLKQRLAPRVFGSTQALGIAPEWVEACAFAWMAKRTLEHEASNLPSVTGADREVILGGIYVG